MKKKFITVMLLITMLLLLTNCAKKDEQTPEEPEEKDTPEKVEDQIPAPDDMILSAEAWKDKFPLIYNSFVRNSQVADDKEEDSTLGGSQPIDYLEKYPNIAILYEGVGFSKEYYAARGHYYALDDVINTARPKSGASCLACKTPEYEKLYAEHGDEFFAMDFQKVVQDVENGISCYNCHRNTPGEGIQTTGLQFNAAVDKLDKELKPGESACAQCHVEYYMESDTKEVVLPWDKGIEIADIESYYDELDFSDWTHPRTGTPLLKVQHPDFEMNQGGLHTSMGVTCADCHMPKVEENGEEYRSHWPTSPLKSAEESCGKCHKVEEEGLIAKVEGIQKDIESKEVEVSNLLVKLIEDFAAAIEEKNLNDETIEKVRDLHRKAQYRWDFVFVENSTGFHNPSKAKKALAQAKEYAEEALGILNPQ